MWWMGSDYLRTAEVQYGELWSSLGKASLIKLNLAQALCPRSSLFLYSLVCWLESIHTYIQRDTVQMLHFASPCIGLLAEVARPHSLRTPPTFSGAYREFRQGTGQVQGLEGQDKTGLGAWWIWNIQVINEEIHDLVYARFSMHVQYKNVGDKSPPHTPTGHVSPPTPWPAVASSLPRGATCNRDRNTDTDADSPRETESGLGWAGQESRNIQRSPPIVQEAMIGQVPS